MISLSAFVEPMEMEFPDAPNCPHCGKHSRTLGIEDHTDLKYIVVFTFECNECGEQTTITLARM
jgi:hypothetical protein